MIYSDAFFGMLDLIDVNDDGFGFPGKLVPLRTCRLDGQSVPDAEHQIGVLQDKICVSVCAGHSAHCPKIQRVIEREDIIAFSAEDSRHSGDFQKLNHILLRESGPNSVPGKKNRTLRLFQRLEDKFHIRFVN